MGTVPMVIAVKRNALGDVIEVEKGTADTDTNAWTPNGAPAVLPVIEIVNVVMGGSEVWSRLQSGAPGPKFKVVPAQGGHGVETIQLDDATLTVADLAQF